MLRVADRRSWAVWVPKGLTLPSLRWQSKQKPLRWNRGVGWGVLQGWKWSKSKVGNKVLITWNTISDFTFTMGLKNLNTNVSTFVRSSVAVFALSSWDISSFVCKELKDCKQTLNISTLHSVAFRTCPYLIPQIPRSLTKHFSRDFCHSEKYSYSISGVWHHTILCSFHLKPSFQILRHSILTSIISVWT